jgi:hypothetical protein
VLPPTFGEPFPKVWRSVIVFDPGKSDDAIEAFQPGMGQAEAFRQAHEFGRLP